MIEYYQKFRLFDNQIPGPCIIEREFTADNLCFPLLVLVAEMNYLNSLGAIGLTCMLEPFCVMSLTQADSIRKICPHARAVLPRSGRCAHSGLH